MNQIDRDRITEAIQSHKAMVDQFEGSAIETVIAVARVIVETFQRHGTLNADERIYGLAQGL